jgi:adenosine deaminase
MRDLRALPKAHLHLHLEGAMRPATLIDLATQHGLPEPSIVGDGDFATFLQLYRAACQVLRTPDDLVRLVREVAEDAAEAGAVWVEPSEWLAPGQAERFGLHNEEALLEVLVDAAQRAERDTGVGVGVMLAANRERPLEEAVSLAQLAARWAGRGVVTFGVAGDEVAGRPELFAPAFDITRAAGLISAPHGGELVGPHSVQGALEALGAQRIQHGVRAIEDPRLVERLASSGVCLDVCPTSNVQLRVVSRLEEHPLPALLAAGVSASLNSDDPLFFGSGLLQEYELARTAFGLDDATLASIAASSIRASGAPQGTKARALADIDRWLAA